MRLHAKPGQMKHALRLHATVRRTEQARRLAVQVQARQAVAAKSVSPRQLRVQRLMGEGSFGQVYQGTWVTPAGEEQVVLKRVKAKVEGAEMMGQMELVLNAYASKVAKNHIADFIGYAEVAPEEATPKLSPGLWLMWRYEGSRTLAYYMRRRDTLRALSKDLEVTEEAVVATVMKHIFEGLAAFHAAGLVHRDIKPLNCIFAEEPQRFKLIDLGACADLRSGTNWTPDESILDPAYCAPEQYILPTDSPNLSKSFFKVAISPVLWAQHKPDRFDMWSAGVTMLQLAVPSMRQDRFLKKFNAEFGPRFDYDLDAWRKGSLIANREFEVLDADNGAGWDLAKSLLRPRSIKVLPDNTVVFVNDNSAQRVSAAEALKHKFMRQAREPGSVYTEEDLNSYSSMDADVMISSSTAGRSRGTASAGGTSSGSRGSKKGTGTTLTLEDRMAGRTANSFGAAVGLWKNLTGKLFDLEANIMVQASATERQSTVVKQMKDKAAKGEIPTEVVRQEQRKLAAMEKQLEGMQEDFNSTASTVGNVLNFLGFGPKSKSKGVKASQATFGEEVPLSSKQKRASPGGSGVAAPSRSSTAKGSAGVATKSSSGSRGQSSSPRSIFSNPFASSVSVDQEEAVGMKSRSGSGKQGKEEAIDGVKPKQQNGLWALFQSRMNNLEDKLTNQQLQTERQMFTVRKLRAGVRKGEVDSDTLMKAEAILSRMERRVDELDADLKRTREEATGILGLLSGASGSGKQNTSGSGSTSAKQAGGVAGFFSRVFGGGSASTKQTELPDLVSYSADKSSKASSGKTGKQQRPVIGDDDEWEVQDTKPAVEPGNIITSSLKFTGMAAKVALGVAASLKADAERALKELEAEREARRQRKLAEQAFLRMLGSKDPAMQPGTSFAEVEDAFGADPRFLAVEPSQRPLLVATFVDALLQAQQRNQQAAQAKLRDLLRLRITLESSWDQVVEQYGDDPVFLAVEDPELRRSVFEEAFAALQSANDNRLAAGLAENAFIEMLQELEPPLSPDANWQRVKPLLWRDYRYLAIPETRRKALFDEVMVIMTAEQETKDKAAQQQINVEASSVAQMLIDANSAMAPGPAPAVPEPSAAEAGAGATLLNELRKEQARLRSEYDAMERKLREMEAALAAKERSAQFLDEREVTVPGQAKPQTMRVAAAAKDGPAVRASGRGAAAAGGQKRVVARVSRRGQRAGSVIQTIPLNQESQLADSLMSAGVNYSRLEDGTLVFSFDENEVNNVSQEIQEALASVTIKQ